MVAVVTLTFYCSVVTGVLRKFIRTILGIASRMYSPPGIRAGRGLARFAGTPTRDRSLGRDDRVDSGCTGVKVTVPTAQPFSPSFLRLSPHFSASFPSFCERVDFGKHDMQAAKVVRSASDEKVASLEAIDDVERLGPGIEAAAEKRLLRKYDLYILPIMTLIFLLNFIGNSSFPSLPARARHAARPPRASSASSRPIWGEDPELTLLSLLDRSAVGNANAVRSGVAVLFESETHTRAARLV